MPESAKSSSAYLRYLQDGGEMGELTRTFNWSETVLGHPDSWPESLLTTLSIILRSKFPMFLWWGTELIQFYNDAYRPSLGNRGKHPLALGQHGKDCWPEIWPEIKPMIDQVMNFGESTWDEDRLIPIDRNGQIENVYWTFSYTPVNNGAGKFGGVLVICNETTEKVKALQKEKVAKTKNKKLAAVNEELIKTQQRLSKAYDQLWEQEGKTRNIIEQAPVAIAIFKGPDFIIELFNDKVLEYWGRTAEQVKNKPLFGALPEASNQGFEQLLTKVLTTGERFTAEELPVKLIRNGILETTWINFIYEPFKDISGRVTEIMVVCNEVTEQVNARNIAEESEKKFRQVADSVVQMIWIADGNGMHEYYNKRWYDFTGTTFEQGKGTGWSQMFHPDDRERAWETWNCALKTGNIYEIEYRLRSKDGDYIWVLGRAAPFYNSNGVIVKWFGTCTDINEQRLLLQQKDDFISIASHELKTPITTLTASLQLLNKMKDNPSAKLLPSLLDRANRSLDKVNLLISNLLNATQFNNGQLHLNKSCIVLSELIEACCANIHEEGIFKITIEGDKNLVACVDTSRIEQVIINFLNNAVKYAHDSKEILITIEKINDRAKVAVTDKGPGIPSNQIPHLFERFFRVDNSGSQYSGLGLGLYISAEIIRKHKGQIGADSVVGKGSTFWFTIPI